MNKENYPHLIIFSSPYSVDESLDKLETVLNEKQIKIFARFDHGQEAKNVNLEIPAIQVLVFGDPKVGTFLMQDDPLVAIELPLRVLAWEDAEGTKLAYEDPALTAKPYQITTHKEIVSKMQGFMNMIVTSAIK